MTEPTLLQQARQHVLFADDRLGHLNPGGLCEVISAVECILQHLEQREAAMREPAQVPGEKVYRMAVERGADGFATLVAKAEPSPANALDLDELQRLCDAATPGPWELADEDGWVVRRVAANSRQTVCSFHEAADGAFVAAARDALPKLIARVRELEGHLEAARPIVALHKLRTGQSYSPGVNAIEADDDDE